MKTDIIIVGGGASCIAFIDALIIEKNSRKLDNISITVLESAEEPGPGNAYSDDLQTNILNTKAGYITVFKNYKGDFFRWLSYNEYKWKSAYPGLEVKYDTYAPRGLFGMYMKDAFSYVCTRAQHSGISVKVIRDEVTNLQPAGKDRVNIKTKNGLILQGSKVILACGTQQRSSGPTSGGNNIIHSPYPTKELVKKISRHERVAIIGARLSAVDAIIGLIETGHRGPVTMYSRSGFFPFIRGTQGRYQNAYLCTKYISENYPSLDFNKLGSLYLKERGRYCELSDDDYFEELPLSHKPIDCLEEFLVKELHLAERNRGWQAILYDTNPCIDRIWNRLIPEEQQIFIAKYLSSAMSLRVSIPPENAKKILHYLHSGQLKFVTGKTFIETEDGVIKVHNNGSSIPVDRVVYATGSPRRLSEMDSPLVQNLLKDGICTENKFGGLDVCKFSYALLNKNAEMNTNIFAIGELTSGCFLFTSALDIIVRHAHACANRVMEIINEGEASAVDI
jgi:uncharacterized NAD(P)/FAD-binding protein YdhS